MREQEPQRTCSAGPTRAAPSLSRQLCEGTHAGRHALITHFSGQHRYPQSLYKAHCSDTPLQCYWKRQGLLLGREQVSSAGAQVGAYRRQEEVSVQRTTLVQCVWP